MPADLLPLQSGVGNVANAVMAGLVDSEFEHLTAFTEVIQDGLLDLLDSGKLASVSATSFGLSPTGVQRFLDNVGAYKGRILLRSEEISNHPELVRRLGVIAINGMIEADLYGNVNSTHVMGSAIMNGIGGSGDFARNAFLNFFVSPSQAKGGLISSIVPMVSHVDHTEHDVHVLVTERGLADLRGSLAQRPGRADHRALRAPRLPGPADRLRRPGPGGAAHRPAHPAPARRGPQLARRTTWRRGGCEHRGGDLRLGWHAHPLARRRLPRRVARPRPGGDRRRPRPRGLSRPAPRGRCHRLGPIPRPPAERHRRRPLRRGRCSVTIPSCSTAYFEFWEPHTLTDPEVGPLFEALRDDGIQVGVLSNTIWPRAWHEGFFVATASST